MGIVRTAAYVAKYYLDQKQDSNALQYLTIFSQDTNALNWSQDNYHYLHSQYLAQTGNYAGGYNELRKLYDNLYQQLLSDAKVRTYAIARRYDLEREQERTLRLTIARQRLWITIGTVLLILLTVTALAYWIIQQQRRKAKRLEEEKDIAKAQQEKAEAKAEAAKARQETQAAQTKKLKRTTGKQKEQLCRSLHDRVLLISDLKEQQKLHPQNTPDWLKSYIKAHQLNNASGWKYFSDEFEKIYGNKPETLREKCPRLTNEDIRYLSLTLVGLNMDDISNLLQLESRTLWNRKQKIQLRLGTKDLTAWLDDWQENNDNHSKDDDDNR